ncbi:MAG: GNAT family N-acetyltransferase [Clostridia bacterium]|nr:GNAT family N-acetyltransferase [Clostridia bacterium]
MELYTERLCLRPWREEDAEALYPLARDPDVGPPAGWMPHTSVENSRQIIRTVLSAPTVFAVCKREDGMPIGSIGLHKNDLACHDDEYELGYWIGKPYWGQGMIPEASLEVLRYAFEDLGMARIWCGHYDGNVKSRRVQEKLGFVFHHTTEGIEITELNQIRTGHVMLMTRERWEELCWCKYLGRCIDKGMCYDMQMIAMDCIKPSALTEIDIDKVLLNEVCKCCPNKIG